MWPPDRAGVAHATWLVSGPAHHGAVRELPGTSGLVPQFACGLKRSLQHQPYWRTVMSPIRKGDPLPACGGSLLNDNAGLACDGRWFTIGRWSPKLRTTWTGQR